MLFTIEMIKCFPNLSLCKTVKKEDVCDPAQKTTKPASTFSTRTFQQEEKTKKQHKNINGADLAKRAVTP